MGRQVQRYGNLARQLERWVGIKEEGAPHRTGSLLLRTQDLGYMDNEPLNVVVFLFIIILYLHRLVQLLGNALWLAKVSTPPCAEKSLTRLFRTNEVYQTQRARLWSSRFRTTKVDAWLV